tara:strand:+ start:234 stop:911 length:678 start_codon:yes stop_codon:yes gene_type:complete
MYKILLTFFISFSIFSDDITLYKAKYQFDSDEISITGIREFKKTNDGYELKFRASNIVASMFFSSVFSIDEYGIKSSKYEIKIRPKFLKRDQSIDFNYKTQVIESNGRNEWKSDLNINDVTIDPLNAQIMIRKNLKENINNFSLNLINMQEGGIEKFDYIVTGTEKCEFKEKVYNCSILERLREGSSRKTTYYLAKELDYMFLKITDVSEDWTNTLELKEILSFG